MKHLITITLLILSTCLPAHAERTVWYCSEIASLGIRDDGQIMEYKPIKFKMIHENKIIRFSEGNFYSNFILSPDLEDGSVYVHSEQWAGAFDGRLYAFDSGLFKYSDLGTDDNYVLISECDKF